MGNMDEIDIAHNALDEIDRAGAETDRRCEEYRKRDRIPLIGWLISIPAYRRYRKAYDNYIDIYNTNITIVHDCLGYGV